ncbi:MAG: Bax inhibitor-1/YccA family protein [Elusimicrobiota bacterium]
MRTANPALNKKTFSEYGRMMGQEYAEGMTLNGTVNKTGILLCCCVLTASFAWSQFFAGNQGGAQGLMLLGALGGFIAALVTIFKKTWSPVTAPVYALLEGLFLGGLSATLEARFPGIVIQAVGLTFGTLFGLLLAYKTGLIRATENFKLGLFAAMGGVFMIYMATFILGFFGISIPYIHGSGLMGIGFSCFVVVIAALNLVLDFDFIEAGCETNAPKYMEWYAAFGLIVTLVWLYVEILRLLSKLRSRD